MKAELKQKWLEALRGGDYQQGSGQLKAAIRGETQYCCLGVLRECAGLQWVERKFADDISEFQPPLPLNAGGYLHYDEAGALGLDFDIANDLAKRNDGNAGYERHTFALLADIIDSQVTVE